MKIAFFPERSKKIKEDAAKWTLILPKLILEYLCLWPELQSVLSKVVGFCLLLNISILLVAHTAYVIENLQDVVKMAEVLTTVNVVFQCFVRMVALISHKNQLRVVLSTVWNDFWPTSILTSSENIKLKKLTTRYFLAVNMFSLAALCTTPQFMYQPLILGIRTLPLMLKLPFSFLSSPIFEILYVWVCCTCMGIIQFTLVGFDLLFTMLVWNCSVQFKILRTVLGRLVDKVDKSYNFFNCTNDQETHENEKAETRLLIKYIQYHQKLLNICNDLEIIFRYVLLNQLLDSALALCLCSFTAIAVPSLLAKMITFAFMHLTQLLVYCAFGNELLHQSTILADAAFRSGWHYSKNLEIRILLLMLMQTSQEGKRLTARGFAVVNYTSCLQVLKMAFSFYTVLDALMQKKNSK